MSKKKDETKYRLGDGGPAFPRTGFYPPSTGTDDIERLREMIPTVTEPTQGMSLFDYYVGQALNGLLANCRTNGGATPNSPDEAREFVAMVGVSAVVFAEAVMAAREDYLKRPVLRPKHDDDD